MDSTLVDIYLETASAAQRLIADDHVAAHWGEPSCLPLMSVGGLAGHLARSITLTEALLDSSTAEGVPLTTAEYYLAGGDLSDLDAPGNRRIRETGEAGATNGPLPLAQAVAHALDRLRRRLPVERLEVAHLWFDRLTTVATVLEARVLEMVVHCDDLAFSVDVSPPELPPAALDLTIATLVEMARRRHSDAAVIRALCRRERDSVNALRVM